MLQNFCPGTYIPKSIVIVLKNEEIMRAERDDFKESFDRRI